MKKSLGILDIFLAARGEDFYVSFKASKYIFSPGLKGSLINKMNPFFIQLHSFK